MKNFLWDIMISVWAKMILHWGCRIASNRLKRFSCKMRFFETIDLLFLVCLHSILCIIMIFMTMLASDTIDFSHLIGDSCEQER